MPPRVLGCVAAIVVHAESVHQGTCRHPQHFCEVPECEYSVGLPLSRRDTTRGGGNIHLYLPLSGSSHEPLARQSAVAVSGSLLGEMSENVGLKAAGS
jgi:hypothetical protein